MTVILDPANGEDLQVNAWRWRPTVSLLALAGVLPQGERRDQCSASGCGGYVTADEAALAASHVESLLNKLAPNERILANGSRTTQGRDMAKAVTEWNEGDAGLVYSVDRAWLSTFAAFCRTSGGFRVI